MAKKIVFICDGDTLTQKKETFLMCEHILRHAFMCDLFPVSSKLRIASLLRIGAMHITVFRFSGPGATR